MIHFRLAFDWHSNVHLLEMLTAREPSSLFASIYKAVNTKGLALRLLHTLVDLQIQIRWSLMCICALVSGLLPWLLCFFILPHGNWVDDHITNILSIINLSHYTHTHLHI